MLNRLIRKISGRRLPEELDYTAARDALETHSLGARRELAEREDVDPEILYYLASDEKSEVRSLVAANPVTPRQADKILADDTDDEVRCELARKIARILPDLGPGTGDKLREMTIEVLESLAQDQLPRVRQILAEEIRGSDLVPRGIIQSLARDLELIVAAPILQYSPLLSDDDLKEIIASTQVTGAIEAVANRQAVSQDVSDAVVATFDVPAVAALLANPNAQIREETLDRIIDDAEEIEAWHRPLVMRPDLSVRAVRRIASFVAVSLLEILSERSGLEEDVADELRRRVRERIQADENSELDDHGQEDHAAAVVEEVRKEGKLNDEFVSDAALDGKWHIAVQALAVLSECPKELISRILQSRSPKSISAITWKAGLGMRTAVKLQTLAQVPHTDILNAKDGREYPLSAEELAWHLDCFGIKA